MMLKKKMVFRCILNLLKSRYCAFLLFLVILVVRNNYRLLFPVNNCSYFRKIEMFRQDYTFIFIILVKLLVVILLASTRYSVS